MIRSEEELVVSTRMVGRERVRLVKRVITETVTRTVDGRREELHIERDTLTDQPAEDLSPAWPTHSPTRPARPVAGGRGWSAIGSGAA